MQQSANAKRLDNSSQYNIYHTYDSVVYMLTLNQAYVQTFSTHSMVWIWRTMIQVQTHIHLDQYLQKAVPAHIKRRQVEGSSLNVINRWTVKETIWDSCIGMIPLNLVIVETSALWLSTFHQRLKTYLFRQQSFCLSHLSILCTLLVDLA